MLADLRNRFVGFVLEAVNAIAPNERLTAKVSFQDAHTLVTEQGQLIQAKRIVIATGSIPVLPPMLKGLGARLLTNENVFELPTLPTSLAVFGSGILGIELAQAMSRLGVDVKVFGIGGGVAGLCQQGLQPRVLPGRVGSGKGRQRNCHRC